jgi:SAM-dependent methyltransferase
MPNRIVAMGHRMLSIPYCYDLFQYTVGSVRFREAFVRENISNYELKSCLDLGCGTASTVNLLPKNVKYIGLDTSNEYLKKAQQRTLGRDSVLINSDISDRHWTTEVEPSKNVLTLALGIFHHINDSQLDSTLENLSLVLKPGSKLISLDPIIDAQTTRAAAWFARNDRGPYIREIDQYRESFGKYGFKLNVTITRNSFRIPYDLILMSALKES